MPVEREVVISASAESMFNNHGKDEKQSNYMMPQELRREPSWNPYASNNEYKYKASASSNDNKR